MLKLNLGSNRYNLKGFQNIDINPEFGCDVVLDLKKLNTAYQENSVDFIYAGHIFEHFRIEETQNVAKQCHQILKPFSSLMVVVPDYTKVIDLPVEKADSIVIAGGEHLSLFNADRLYRILKQAGFRTVTEIDNLNEVPYLIVPDIRNPKPEPWQTAFLALKI